jgi:regulator of cell morphogenesis and NO signaling
LGTPPARDTLKGRRGAISHTDKEGTTMATIELTTTLGALVNEHPELARELERRGLDYCCGGGASLADACATAGVDPLAVADELSAATTGDDPPDWSTMGAVALVDHLVTTHHRYLTDELPRISRLVTKVVTVHGDRHPELRAVAARFDELWADLEPHLQREERVLFPMVRELATAAAMPSFHCGTLRNPIAVMLREHDVVGRLLAELRTLTDGYRPPADGCESYVACYAALAELEADTHLHVHKENILLFPMVTALEQRLGEGL